MEKCCFKCDNYETNSITEMINFIISQCSPEDIITASYSLTNERFALYDGVCDFIVGDFCLSDILIIYRNNILAHEIYDWACDRVDDWLTHELNLVSREHMPMLDISVNINNFHIDLI